MFISLFIFIAVSLSCFIPLFLFPRTSLALSLSSSYLLSSLFVHSIIFSFLHSLISTISLSLILISPTSPSYQFSSLFYHSTYHFLSLFLLITSPHFLHFSLSSYPPSFTLPLYPSLSILSFLHILQPSPLLRPNVYHGRSPQNPPPTRPSVCPCAHGRSRPTRRRSF